MPATLAPRKPDAPPATGRPGTSEPVWVRCLLIAVTLAFLGLFLLIPLLAVFFEALSQGVVAYFSSFRDSEVVSAIELTLLVAAIAVPANIVFGLAASWAIARFEFVGKSLLTTLIDLPFAVSPVISGLIYVLVFGMQGWLGPFLQRHNIQIIFAVPGIVLATMFVTFPFVARELIPLMQEQGSEEEQAALSLGASGLTTFFRITLPNVKWALLYGVILCNARAMGEFGAVSVVSGHLHGRTMTIPLEVESLYNGMGPSSGVAAFSVASLLALLALATLALKSLVEWRARRVALDAQTDAAPAPGTPGIPAIPQEIPG